MHSSITFKVNFLETMDNIQGVIMYKFVIMCLFLSLPVLAYAGEAEKKKNVEELLVLTNAESSIDTIYFQVSKLLQKIANKMGSNPEDRKVFEKYNSRIMDEMKKEVNWKKMKASMINIYMKHYTEKEINDMVAFYKSETGRSMVRKTPEVMKDTMSASQSMVNDFTPRMNELMQEMRKELNTVNEKNKK